MPDFFHSNLKQGLFDSSNQIMIIEKGLFQYMEIKGGKTTIQKASFALDPKVFLVVKRIVTIEWTSTLFGRRVSELQSPVLLMEVGVSTTVASKLEKSANLA